MNPLHIEPLEPRTLLSAHNSVTATATSAYSQEDATTFDTVTLSWTRAAITPIDGFDILRSFDGGATYQSWGTATKSPFIDGDDIDEGAQYFYKVCPFTSAGGDQASLGSASVITPLPPPQLQLDTLADGSISATAASDTINTQSFKLTWWPDNDPSKTSSKTLAAQIDTQSGADEASDATTTIDGLNPAIQYDFRLRQSDALTTSDSTSQSMVPLILPQKLKTQPQPDQTILISWKDNSTVTTGFNLFWSPDRASQAPSGSLTVGKKARSAIIDGLAPGTNYEVQVTPLIGKTESAAQSTVDAEVSSPLDTSFNGHGQNVPYTPILTSLANHTAATATASALQKGGKLIVVGTAHHNFQIVQYNSDGSLDTSFGTGGKVSIDFGGDDSASAVVVQPNHDILIAGTSDNSFAIADLKPNGTLNHAFGHHGRIGFSNDQSLTASNLSLASDGESFFISGIATTGSHHTAIIQQFQPNGTPNPIWDSSTARLPNITGAQSPMALQSTQKIILACQLNNSIVVSRFNRDGSVDATFGTGGEQLLHFGKSTQDIFALAIDPRNNSIVLAGSVGSGASSTFTLARLTANGKLDTTFNPTGPTPGTVQSFIKNNHAAAHAVTVLPDGKILAVGTANGNFAIAEYTSAGKLDPNFASDGLATSDQGSPTDIATALANPNNATLYLTGTSGPDFSVGRYFIDA